MDNKFFMVYVEGENAPTFKHTSKESAEKEAQCLANILGKKTFVPEADSEATPDEINIKVDSYEAALRYLGRENFTRVNALPDKHANALIAMYKLITIAEAWDKADEFVPDFDNANQYKWFPWFRYSDDAAGFVSEYLHSMTMTTPGGVSVLGFALNRKNAQPNLGNSSSTYGMTSYYSDNDKRAIYRADNGN